MRCWPNWMTACAISPSVVEAQLGRDVADMPGAGAAGGLGYGAVAFLGANLRRGIEMVLDLTGFDAAAREADLIITGEGHLDGQSAQGKLIQGLCGRAKGTPVIALCGKLSATPEQIKAIGLAAAYSHQQGRTAPGRDAGEYRGQSGKDRRRTGALKVLRSSRPAGPVFHRRACRKAASTHMSSTMG